LDVVETYLFRPQISSGNPKNVFILFTAGSWREKHWSERPMRVIVGREFFVTHGIEGDNTMAGSVNKVILVGNLGADPEIRYMNNGRPVCNLRVATSESWRDRDSGERRERTEWHRVVIFNEGLCKIAEQYLKKGSKIYLEGQLQTRQYEQDGITKYSTEIVLQGFNSALTMLDGAGGGQGGGQGGGGQGGGYGNAPSGGGDRGGYGGPAGSGLGGDFDDDIPF